MELETISQIPQIDERRALIQSFQALLDPDHLRVIAALSAGERSMGELAEATGFPPSLSRGPIGKLIYLELIAIAEQPGRLICRLNRKRLHTLNGALQRLSRDLLAGERPATPADATSLADDERRILRSCFDGEKLKEIPSSQRRLQVVLRWLAEQFEPGRRYPEREVNALIKRYHPDCAALRRSLIDFGYMTREHDVYWRVQTGRPMSG